MVAMGPPVPSSASTSAWSSKVSQILVSASLVAVAVVACAEGATGDTDNSGNADAASLEAASPGKPQEGGSTDPDPEPTDDGGKPQEGGSTANAACTAALDKVKYDFEASDQGWVAQASDDADNEGPAWPYNPWTWGSATLAPPCPSGKCWAAEATQKYAQCQRGEVVSPRIDLSACAGEKVSLVFTHVYSFWSSSPWFDGGIVEISMDDGSSWQQPPATFPGTVKIRTDLNGIYDCALADTFHVNDKGGFTGTQTTPTTFELAIPSNYLNDKVRVRFAQASGVSSQTSNATQSRAATAPGWRIDDVHFTMK